MSLEIAKVLYADVVGKTDIRVNGHCGCPAPGGSGGTITWRDHVTGKKFISHKEWATIKNLANYYEYAKRDLQTHLPCDDPKTGEGFIESYHIDSELGLRIFADALKKHNLA